MGVCEGTNTSVKIRTKLAENIEPDTAMEISNTIQIHRDIICGRPSFNV